MGRTFGDYIVLLLTVIASLASIWAFGAFMSDSLNNQGWVGVAFLGTLCIFFLGYNFYLISNYRKKVRYSGIFDELNSAFSHLHQMERSDPPTPESLITNLNHACDAISRAFTYVYGIDVAVCIKLLSFQDDRPRVITLVRDYKAKTKDRKTGTQDKVQHWLDSHSDFRFIYEKFDNDMFDTTYSYEPRLPIKRDYLNTRLDWDPPRFKIRFVEDQIRRKRWPLAYKSTMVVPIVPLMADEREKEAIRGFLCIDSPKEATFNKTIDVEVLKGLSDGLYNKIDTLHILYSNENGDTDDKTGKREASVKV